MSYLLSVIIPTKERYKYLKECLATLVTIGSQDIEIIVQDNSANNEDIKEYINKLNWEHIKYYHSSLKLSQTENSDLALDKTTGEYVTYIGDDDTISIQMIDVVKWMKELRAEACSFPVAIYYWNDVVFKFIKYPSLSFINKKISIFKVNSLNQLKSTIRMGGTTIGIMPKVYHGIVSKNVLLKVRNITGSFFPGPSPDMANAVALSLCVKKHVYISLPLMVSGYSYKSAGGMGTRGSHKAKISEVAQLHINTEKLWENKIPKIWLGSTIWAESLAKSLKRMNSQKLYNKINWDFLYATMIVFDSDLYVEILPYIKSLKRKITVYKYIILIFIKRVCLFIKNIVFAKFGFSKKRNFKNVSSLSKATEIVNSFNSNTNYFEEMIKNIKL